MCYTARKKKTDSGKAEGNSFPILMHVFLSLLAGKYHHRNITICEWSSFSSCIKNALLMSNVHLILFRLNLIIVACFAITTGFRFGTASKKLLELLSLFCLTDPWNTGRTLVVSHVTTYTTTASYCKDRRRKNCKDRWFLYFKNRWWLICLENSCW